MRGIFREQLRQAVIESAELVQDEAKQTHNFTTKSGKLEDAVKVRSERDGFVGVVYLDEHEAPYARHVYFGTKPHTIVPRERKALRWPDGGKFVFAKRVQHPGTKADKFLVAALRSKKAAIDDVFVRRTGLALEEVAGVIRRRKYTVGG
ncbi:hypothetical protein [uncultured Veillonella sp.]|uniref:hypothetical protein n=1 Tax=uncultured Veillonella sp. TaxID=159268 RepID=UPI002584FFCA|nr:hypothetical protein [uncultured Veillonella sp.]